MSIRVCANQVALAIRPRFDPTMKARRKSRPLWLSLARPAARCYRTLAAGRAQMRVIESSTCSRGVVSGLARSVLRGGRAPCNSLSGMGAARRAPFDLGIARAAAPGNRSISAAIASLRGARRGNILVRGSDGITRQRALPSLQSSARMPVALTPTHLRVGFLCRRQIMRLGSTFVPSTHALRIRDA